MVEEQLECDGVETLLDAVGDRFEAGDFVPVLRDAEVVWSVEEDDEAGGEGCG